MASRWAALDVLSTEVGDSGERPIPLPPSLRGGGGDEWGVPPPTGPCLCKREEEPNTERPSRSRGPVGAEPPQSIRTPPAPGGAGGGRPRLYPRPWPACIHRAHTPGS